MILDSHRPGFTSVEQDSSDTCREHITSMMRRYCSVGQKGQEFSKTFPCRLDSDSDCIRTATSVPSNIPKVAEVRYCLNVSTLKVVLYWSFSWGRGRSGRQHLQT